MSRKNSKSDEQGVVFVWGEDDDLFAQETPHEAETGEVEDIPFPSPADSLDNERGDLEPKCTRTSEESTGVSKTRKRSSRQGKRHLHAQTENEAIASLLIDEPDESTFYRRVSLDEYAVESAAEFETDENGYLQKRKRKETRRSKEEKSLFLRAVECLSRREYSRKELRQRFLQGLNSEEKEKALQEMDEVLDRLENLKYLSDERFAQGRVRVRSSQMGNSRIRGELRRLGVAEENISAAIEEVAESEEIRGYRVWSKRFHELPTDRKERDRQIRYLLYRGFSMSVVDRIIRGKVEPPEESDF